MQILYLNFIICIFLTPEKLGQGKIWKDHNKSRDIYYQPHSTMHVFGCLQEERHSSTP